MSYLKQDVDMDIFKDKEKTKIFLKKHGIDFNAETDDDEISFRGFKGARGKEKFYVNYIKYDNESVGTLKIHWPNGAPKTDEKKLTFTKKIGEWSLDDLQLDGCVKVKNTDKKRRNERLILHHHLSLLICR